MNETISTEFAKFLVKTKAVKFGDFTLKSGLKSNIFFNLGDISKGNDLIELGRFYADFIFNNSLHNVDALFGPAYKGIAISIATSIALYEKYNISIPIAYNRKIAKTHAEGGLFIGHDLSKSEKILIIDDVITDGGTKYEAINMLSVFSNLKIIGIIVGVDRQETNNEGKLKRIKFFEDTSIEIYPITTKSEVLLYK